MDEIEKIISLWKSNILNPSCLKSCDHLCCSKDFSLTEEQARLIFSIDGKMYFPSGKNGQPLLGNNDDAQDGNPEGDQDMIFRTRFSIAEEYCPMHKEGRCGIYDNPLRPKICSDFPVFADAGIRLVVYDSSCSRTERGSALAVFSEAIRQGYRVIDCAEDMEITIKDGRMHKGIIEKK
ncbi:hypothetical protein COV19_00210 [Candidatus Woesearchaeota archaeon CG10_big_fil_rev_8_21_14_0_10_44_13]|nr:MAG: hypothetical protein COV19_00210 [Candidatus Woesearchaeota archaeon CG10_big_fil_rev_8_21_14_0_10_44_13]